MYSSTYCWVVRVKTFLNLKYRKFLHVIMYETVARMIIKSSSAITLSWLFHRDGLRNFGCDTTCLSSSAITLSWLFHRDGLRNFGCDTICLSEMEPSNSLLIKVINPPRKQQLHCPDSSVGLLWEFLIFTQLVYLKCNYQTFDWSRWLIHPEKQQSKGLLQREYNALSFDNDDTLWQYNSLQPIMHIVN